MSEDHWLNDEWLASIREGKKHSMISSRLPEMNLPLFDTNPGVADVIGAIPTLSWNQRRLASRWLARRGETIIGPLAAALEDSTLIDGWIELFLTTGLYSYY